MGNQPLKCLIIEDEPIAAEVIRDYVEQVAFLELRGTCKDAIFALERMHEEQIDVIFLDIHLPKLKGLDFLRSLQQKPQTILTTAYHHYALDAFEEDVVDYLMKPIEFSRFLKAVNKLKRPADTTSPSTNIVPTTNTSPTHKESTATQERPFRFFNVNKQMVKVFYDEILFIESLKDYSKIITREQTVVTRGQIGEMEALLDTHGFLRIHRSYLVNLSAIRAYSATDITVDEQPLPIGRSYKGLVSKALQSYF